MMTHTDRPWAHSRIGESACAALAQGLPASEVWSLLLSALEKRSHRRKPAAIMQQWHNDRFVQPAYIDQRTLLELDSELLAAVPGFEALELSPLAPLGSCSQIALTSQNRVVATVRGTEVVADPSNVLALESARRLRENGSQIVRLATSHRCVRAQAVPRRPGFAAHFRMFCLTSAGHERKDQALLTDSMIEHIKLHLHILQRLQRRGYVFAGVQVQLLASPARAHLARRIGAALPEAAILTAPLEHRYYDGLRFVISAAGRDGAQVPLIDGGNFNWLHQLATNRKLTFVASALGSQLIPYLFRRG